MVVQKLLNKLWITTKNLVFLESRVIFFLNKETVFPYENIFYLMEKVKKKWIFWSNEKKKFPMKNDSSSTLLFSSLLFTVLFSFRGEPLKWKKILIDGNSVVVHEKQTNTTFSTLKAISFVLHKARNRETDFQALVKIPCVTCCCNDQITLNLQNDTWDHCLELLKSFQVRIYSRQ